MTRNLVSHRRSQWTRLAVGFAGALVLLAAPSAFSQIIPSENARTALRNDPQLYHDGLAFLALSPSKQQAMRKLHEDLAKLASAERDWLKDVLQRYGEWLEKLTEEDRASVVNAPDNSTRLRRIKELRERQWIARLPKATKQQLDKLQAVKKPLEKLPNTKAAKAVAAASTIGLLLGPPRSMRPLNAASTSLVLTTDLRAETIKRLKSDESQKNRDWLIAKRFWTDIDPTFKGRPAMPTHPADFGPEVNTFIREYLRPALSKEELFRLDKAEGRWPQYPLTLVELADKHPMALPQAKGPTTFNALPTEVQKKITVKKKDFIKKSPDELFNAAKSSKDAKARLAKIPIPKPTAAMTFACVVGTYVNSKQLTMPYELWAARPLDLSVSMQVFLNEKGEFLPNLSPEEKKQLTDALGKWPEYPLKVQELAKKYGLTPPWQTLPPIAGKSGVWDKYRVNPHQRLESPASMQKLKREGPFKEGDPPELPKQVPGVAALPGF